MDHIYKKMFGMLRVAAPFRRAVALRWLSTLISSGDVVEFEFKSCLLDGTVIHSDISKVRVGSDAITEQMSRAMLGKQVGGEFEIQTTPEQRGSVRNEELVMDINMPVGFAKENQFNVGDFVEIPDPKDEKEIYLARILEIVHKEGEEEEVIKLDMNDPYSDDVIVVKGKILQNLGKDEKFSEVEYERERLRLRQEKIDEMAKKNE
jgi:FKBP-type peptidyl-prolyl cis-trans isomerase 2